MNLNLKKKINKPKKIIPTTKSPIIKLKKILLSLSKNK